MTPIPWRERAARKLCELRGLDPDRKDFFGVPAWFAELHEEIMPQIELAPEHRHPQVAEAIAFAREVGDG